jgi:hypothetical protein
VDIQVATNGPSPNLTITTLGNGSYSILGDGVPGLTYRIEFTDSSPSANWQTLGTATANPVGIFEFVDPDGSAQRCYRSIYP